MYITPALMEAFLLTAVGICPRHLISEYPNMFASSLLFAMGMQNSLVTYISGATVRATHLTGLFTDLGREISQLFFYRTVGLRQKIILLYKAAHDHHLLFFYRRPSRRFLYSATGIRILVGAATLLLCGLFFDNLKYHTIILQRKLRR